jgi:hypothetical protein
MSSVSPGTLIWTGHRASSSPKARVTLVYSRLPNKAELDDECAALIHETSFTGRALTNTASPKSFRSKSDDFSARLADSGVDIGSNPSLIFNRAAQQPPHQQIQAQRSLGRLCPSIS